MIPRVSDTSRYSVKTLLRMSDDLHERLKDAAKRNVRSMNSEINHRLEESFQIGKELAPVLAALLEEHIQNEVKLRLHAIASHLGATE